MNKLTVSLAFILFIAFAYALTFEDKTSNDFNNGTYTNAVYNGSAVILSGNNITGTFTSRIFDATYVARWNNLSYSKFLSWIEYYYAVDISADFWESNNSGVTWTKIKDDYNGADGNTADSLSKNSFGSLFIMNNQDIWVSNDFGYTWTKINDDYNGGETYSGAVFKIDKNDALILIDTNEQVWKSTDSGVSFTKINTSFSASTSNAYGIAINNTNTYFVVDGLSDVYKSTDVGVSWTKINDDYNGAAANGASNGMNSNSSGSLFIMDGQDVWTSMDYGVNWAKINDDFNGAVDTSNSQLIYFDLKDNAYIIDATEDVYFSNNSGVNFTNVSGNMNGASSNVVGMASLNMTTNLTFQVRNCSLADCSDGTWQTVNLSNINLTGRYFQYKSNFSSLKTGLTPLLYNASIDYSFVDTIPPQFSNYAENLSNNSAYVFGQNYKLNVTISESNPNTTWINFNGVNYSSISNTSNVYTFSISGLGVGVYTYTWWANDTLGNINNSGIRYYYITKANPSFNMNITGTTPITYGDMSDFSGAETNNGDSGCIYSINTSNNVFAAENITFNYSTSGCENYTSGSITRQLIVNKAVPTMTLDGTTSIIYGTSADVLADETNNGDGDLTYLLYRNGLLLPGLSDNTVLAANNYTYMFTTSGGQNYTSRGVLLDISVLRVTSSTNLTITNYTQLGSLYINASCSSNNSEGVLKLYRNNVDVTSENFLDVVLPAGNYTYICNVSETQNYTSASSSENLTIDKNPGDINLYLNGVQDNLTVQSINNINVSASTLYGAILILKNGTDITAENGINQTYIAGFYNITAISDGDENHSSASITLWINVTSDGIAPALTLISPDGSVFGYSNNILLDFSVSDQNLEECWFNINSGLNTTIQNCQSTSFNLSGTGDYVINLYANDSYGNLAFETANFSVELNAPTITLHSPYNVYLNSSNVTFNYTVSDIDLEACELWGNFSGTFQQNQVDLNPTNFSENYFNLSLFDGIYRWNIKCNDSNGHSAFDGNKIFYVDTLNPSMTLSEPSGVKSSRSVTAVWNVSDASPTNCTYNVYRGENLEISNTSVLCDQGSTTFSVTIDADFTINFYASDILNHSTMKSSNFSVSLSQSPSSSGGGGSSSGGTVIKKLIPSLSIGKIDNIFVNTAGVKKILSLNAKNNGTSYLNDCVFKSSGVYSSWISRSETKGLASGEEYNYIFDVNIPENTSPGKYKIDVSVECKEVKQSTSFDVNIEKKQLDFKLVGIERSKSDQIKVDYNMKELSGNDQNVNIQFFVFDKDGKKIVEVNESRFLSANSSQDFEFFITIPSDLSGELGLLVNLNSERYSGFVQEKVILGSPISGLTILDRIGNSDNILSVVLVILFLAFALFVVKKIRNRQKNAKDHVRHMIRKNFKR